MPSVLLVFCTTAVLSLCLGSKALAKEVGVHLRRTKVALVGFSNQSRNPGAGFWSPSLDRLFSEQIRIMGNLRRVSGISYACKLLNVRPEALAPKSARRLGGIVQADWVIWGWYHPEQTNWRADAVVLNVASGHTTTNSSVASADWFEVRDTLMRKILTAMGVVPTPRQLEQLRHRGTDSPRALEWFSRALAENAAPRDKVQDARNAIEADPSWAEPHALLSSLLGTAGQIREAEAEARAALHLRPEYAPAHQVLGACYAIAGKYQRAIQELSAATSLDPEYAEAFLRLGQVWDQQQQTANAVASCKEALKLNPFSPSAHALLGDLYAEQGNRKGGLRELKAAEKLTTSEDANTEQSLFSGYAALDDTPAAVFHCERFVKLARASGAGADALHACEEVLRELTATLSPSFVKAVPPKDFKESAIMKELQSRLRPKELREVTNPLLATPEMVLWARRATSAATNDLDRARMLFAAMEDRMIARGAGKMLTAAEAFAMLKQSSPSLGCEDSSCLYVALVRAVGLRAYVVSVEEGANGQQGMHACAAVFLPERALLVDPTVCWFGAPDRKFKVLDDLQVVADYLAEQFDLEHVEIAAKITPQSAFVQGNLVLALLRQGETNQAYAVMTNFLTLGPQVPFADYIRANWEVRAGQLDQASKLLRDSLAVAPEDGTSHLLLSSTYAHLGKTREARAELQAALDCNLSANDEETARCEMAKLERQLRDD